MNKNIVHAGFIGAGGIARSHAFALNSLKYYYDDAPETRLIAVASSTERSRTAFASRFGFENAFHPDDFFSDNRIDTVYILGPNNVHAEHIRRAASMPSIRRIYVEKPVCSSLKDEEEIMKVINEHPEISIQTGFQFLFMAALREALLFWKTGKAGKPVHFDLKYFHGDYLRKEYRDKRATRLTPAPEGGAMADLGSHAISLLLAFLGNKIRVRSANTAGSFADVNPASDLFSMAVLSDEASGACGTVSASRISSGTGDLLGLELYAEKGALRFSTVTPDYFEFYLEETGNRTKVMAGSSFGKISSFPSGHVPPGWLRAMIHSHYVFLTANDPDAFIPDIAHGLQVQRILREIASLF